MVLDDKGAVEAERLGLDIVLDPLAETLAAVGHFRAGAGPPRLRAAEKSETHLGRSFVEAPLEAAARLPACAAIPEMLRYYRSHRAAASQGGGVPEIPYSPGIFSIAGAGTWRIS